MLVDTILTTAVSRFQNIAPEDRDDMRQECYLMLLRKQDAIQRATEGRPQRDKEGYIYRLFVRVCVDTVQKMDKVRRAEVSGMAFHRGLQRSIAQGKPDAVYYRDELPTESMTGMEERPFRRDATELDRLSRFGVSDSALRGAFFKLDSNTQILVEGIFSEDLSEREVGKGFGKSQTWVRSRKEEALGAMKASLSYQASAAS